MRKCEVLGFSRPIWAVSIAVSPRAVFRQTPPRRRDLIERLRSSRQASRSAEAPHAGRWVKVQRRRGIPDLHEAKRRSLHRVSVELADRFGSRCFQIEFAIHPGAGGKCCFTFRIAASAKPNTRSSQGFRLVVATVRRSPSQRGRRPRGICGADGNARSLPEAAQDRPAIGAGVTTGARSPGGAAARCRLLICLVGTNVISAVRRSDRVPQVAAWPAGEEFYPSVVSLGEVARRIRLQAVKTPGFAADPTARLNHTMRVVRTVSCPSRPRMRGSESDSRRVSGISGRT